MTYKILPSTFLLFAFVATTLTANAQSVVVTRFDASNESVQENGNEQTLSVVNTPLVSNSEYDTRSFEIQDGVSPVVSGVFTPGVGDTTTDPYLFVQSSQTQAGSNPGVTLNPNSQAFHEFSVTLGDNFQELDTLSFDYLALRDAGDAEVDNNFTYGVRTFASVDGFTSENFSTVGDATLLLDSVNTSNSGSFTFSNLATLPGLQGLDTGDEVTFRLSFFDRNGNEITSSTGEHRLDNVQLTAVPVAAVPEPSGLCLLIGGFGLLSLRRRR